MLPNCTLETCCTLHLPATAMHMWTCGLEGPSRNEVQLGVLITLFLLLRHLCECSFFYLLFSKQFYCLFSNLDLIMGISYKGIQVIVGVLTAFDYLAVGLRLWARKIKGKPLQINDYLIVVGLVWIRIVTTVKTSISIDLGTVFHNLLVYLRGS